MKEMADRAGTIMVRNTQLEGELRELKGKLSRAEGERERLLGLIADQKLVDLDGSGDLVRDRARELGILPEQGDGEPEAGEPGLPSRCGKDTARRTGSVPPVSSFVECISRPRRLRSLPRRPCVRFWVNTNSMICWPTGIS